MFNTPDHNLEKLKEGYLFWNKYRNSLENQTDQIDLSNVQVAGKHWRYNEMKSAELHNCNFKNTHFRDIDFIDIDFSKSDFSNARFSNVHFTKCHFSSNSFKNVYFKDTSWYYASMKELAFPGLKNFENIRFYKCSFDSAVFKGIDMPEDIFEGCNFNYLV